MDKRIIVSITVEAAAARDIKTGDYTFAKQGDKLHVKAMLNQEEIEQLNQAGGKIEEIQKFLLDKLSEFLMVRRDNSYVKVRKGTIVPTGAYEIDSENGAKTQ